MARSMRRLNLTWRFALAALATTVIVGVAVAWFSSQAITHGALQDAQMEARSTLTHRVLWELRDVAPQGLNGPLTGAQLTEFDHFIRMSVLSDRMARIKVWDTQGRIIYSDDLSEIGGTFPIEDELASALRGETASDLTNGHKSENVDERQFGPLLEVYTPIVYPNSTQVVGAFELYQAYAPVKARIAFVERLVFSGLALGLSLLYLVSLGIVHSGARTIERQHNELLQAFDEKLEAERARARLTSILDATTDYVTTTDKDGRALYVNPAARRVLGIGMDEDISALGIDEIYPEWAHTVVRDEGLPNALQDGVWSGETALQSRAGYEVPVSHVLLAHKTLAGELDFVSSVARDISERKFYETQLVHLASHDALTDLYNRRRFEEEVERELAHTRRFGAGGALLFVDLDGFKGVNDSLGHHAGDQFLVSLAVMLRNCLRETEVLARLGGDEFAVLMPRTDRRRAEAIAAAVLQAVRGFTMIINGEPVRTTVSGGIALFPEHGTTADELLVHADLAMYEAKEQRDEFRVYRPDRSMEAVYATRRLWEQRLREALEQERFLLYLQPIQDLRGAAAQYELLLRLRGETGEIILPGAFLDTAERTGIIRAIDRWVVREAIHLIARQEREGQELILEVNLSGKALTDHELLELIERELAATRIQPSHLIFEITETAAIADINEAQRFIARLRDLGCRFALDDFGVGFSSFYYLKHLPVDYLKIDGSFIRDLSRDAIDQHLVRAIVEVARGLGKRTVAEFVEEEETVRLLREYGVDYAQGYYVGRPAPVAQVLADAEASMIAATVAPVRRRAARL